jgi:ribosome maturation factor RimP
MLETEAVQADIERVLEPVGLKLVDFILNRHKGATQVRLIVYRAEGTGIGECSKAHRLVQPRLQILLGEPDFSLEVSSPGIDRIFRSSREYAVFIGRGVKLLEKESGIWMGGRIESVTESSVTVKTKDGERTIAFATISKAQLDDSLEGV